MMHNCRCNTFVTRGLKSIRFSSSSSTTTWERSALRVKDTEGEKNNPYLDLIRDSHDPSLHLKTLEDELKGTIGRALGKQGEKIQYALRRMQTEYHSYELLQRATEKGLDVETNKAIVETARKFNEYRKQAIQARWELMVHRQAAGMIVDNHRFVAQHYPIPDALPMMITDEVTAEKGTVFSANTNNDAPREANKFKDHLDWWQRFKLLR